VEHQFVSSLIGERIGGRYLVERTLGSGGMGLIAVGRNPELDQTVAIKFMRPELAAMPVLAARFLREARLLARVKSQHFVRVFDFGRLESGVPYLVMEMLDGHDLHDELDDRGPLPIAEAVDILLQAAAGVAELHSLGVVHRDLKPSNLFLADAAGQRTVKVLDFGVSKEASSASDGLTSTGNLVGTPQYMAPEQVREARTTDARADVWSLGVILYECLTHGLPFGEHGDAVGEVCGRILHTPPTPPRSRRADLPAELEATILKCLLREPDERYADVGALAEGLRPFATAASLARIDTIHLALSMKRPLDADSSGKIARLEATPPTAATAVASPVARGRAQPGTTPTKDQVPPVLAAAGAGRPVTPKPETSMSAAGPTGAPVGSRAWSIGLVGAAALVAGVIATMLLRAGGTNAPPPASAASSATPTSTSTPTPTATPIATPTATPTAASSTPALIPLHHHAPRAPASATPSSSADLLLDRK
jgi:serine/threonine-protein kinase